MEAHIGPYDISGAASIAAEYVRTGLRAGIYQWGKAFLVRGVPKETVGNWGEIGMYVFVMEPGSTNPVEIEYSLAAI